MYYDMTKLEELNTSMKEERASLLTYLSDKNVSLEDRWHMYCKAVETGYITANKSYGDGYLDLLGRDNPYVDLGMERHETRYFSDMFDPIDEGDFTSGQVEAWKEKVLSSGYASFTFDW